MENSDYFFKTSTKSICHKCFNVKERCSLSTDKTCDTDAKIEASFVKSCNKFNKVFTDKLSTTGQSLSIEFNSDSRIDSMGGGFHLVDKYKNDNGSEGIYGRNK